MRFIQIASNLLTLASKSCIEGGSIFLNIRESFIDSEWITYDVCVEDRDYNENKDYTVQIDRPLSTNLHHISKDNADFHLLKILVEAMGGGISISGNKDSDIKYCLSMSFKYQPLQIKEEQIVKPYFKNKKALVVENNKISQRVIIRMLEKLGFENEVSSNGQDALNIFKNSKDNEYNLIITDSDLPIMDGYQVCKKIRELNRLDSKDVSIILISDKLTEDVIKKKEFFGVDTLLLKPIEENRVHQNIINLLNR